ncbi:hypothetical protein [Kitasatospora sp. NPDC059327]|uniref:hypothetical protein n=1 Tax=Kitasatospora sp. NPDC059327 TaxID=3346803 RepID=UPI0036BEE741
MYQGLSERQPYLENAGDQISRYAHGVSANPDTPSVNVTRVDTFYSSYSSYSFGDVRRWTALDGDADRRHQPGQLHR